MLNMKKKVIITICIILVAIIAWIAIDFVRSDKIQKIPSRPEQPKIGNENAYLLALEQGEEYEDELVLDICRYVDGRYDCSDFRLVSLMRIMYKYGDEIPDVQYEAIKDTLLNFKYWMDQPGEDSMCFWSENHQLLFATAEYLAGQIFPGEIFTNDGKTGTEHMEIAKGRLNIWFEQRFDYGFVEWYSNTYYVEDIGPLSNLIDFAEDEEIQQKSTMIMDLLLYDLATQSYKGALMSTSGRCYENGKKSGEKNSMRTVANEIWPEFQIGSRHEGMDVNFFLIDNYEVPEVIKVIGRDHNNVVIKASTGLDLSELKGEDLIGQSSNQIMMQWAMEAFTNPEIIGNTMRYIDDNNMFSNEFLNDFKMININFLKYSNLLPTVSRVLNPKTNGVAIQRANTYTYRTEDYMLATAQSHHPGEFADQQHIWSATLGYEFSVFTTHPAKPLGDGALSGSPSYWVGSGRLPHSAQDENINMSIYSIEDRKGFMEDTLVFYTHAYFPTELFDQVLIENNIAFGKYNNAYIALIGKNKLKFQEGTTDDLIQDGELTYWICELAATDEYASFDEFIDYIKSKEVLFDKESMHLSYTSNDKTMELTFGGDFLVNSKLIDTDYQRFLSPYSETERKPTTILIEFDGKSLYLDFDNLERIVID